jgi:phosphatidylglycerophosphatase C
MAKTKALDPIQLVAFDFDGTITTTDTFAKFLRYYAGPVKWSVNILKLMPVFIGYVFKLVSRDQVKAGLVRTFFTGADAKDFQARADQFATEVIPGLIRPAALEGLTGKNKTPYTVYIVSASISPYLKTWAKMHGINNVIGTDLKIEDGRLTGELDGRNCWGPGKIAKIEQEMGKNPYILVEAYGDTRGDREMLHASQESFFKPFRL